MWCRALCNPWTVLVLLVIGGPGTLDDLSVWVSVLGVNMLTTVALMGLAAHVTAVGFQNWEPYRSWFRRAFEPWFMARATTVRVACLTEDVDKQTVERRETRLPVAKDSLVEFPIVEGRPRYCLEVPFGFRVEFQNDERYFAPKIYARWPYGGRNQYVFADRPLPKFAQCKIAIYWSGGEERWAR